MATPTERSIAMVVRPFRSTRTTLSAVAALLVVSFFVLFWASDDYSSSFPQFFPGSQSNNAEEDSLTSPPPPPEPTTASPSTSPSVSSSVSPSVSPSTSPSVSPSVSSSASPSSIALSSTAEFDVINSTLQYFRDYPIKSPYKDVFGQLGQRTQILRSWMAVADSKEHGSVEQRQFVELVDSAAQALFPFLSTLPRNEASVTPFADLRATFQPGSKGIVIPAGGKSAWRFACHLVGALRKVHRSTLPILIVYAGEEDLPVIKRETLAAISDIKNGGGIEFLDITTVFDDKVVGLIGDGWALKPFAALAAPFEHVALFDADAVMLQPPERLFDQQNYIDTGALLFHDRLLWQHGFKERHEWWRSQVKHESPALAKSLVWTEEYAEEEDSGVVVFDKSRLDILTGMLHICWQNTRDVRNEITYKITYGDKESYWFGLELSGATYSFESHYGSMVGWLNEEGKKVCSFVIAHTDEKDALLWYNGSLLKNKIVNETYFETPTKWMLDGTWEKGGSKPEMSCMVDTEIRDLTEAEIKVLEESIEVAKDMDRDLELV